MAEEILTSEQPLELVYKKQSLFGQVVKRLLKSKTAVFGLIVVALIVAVSVFAPFFAPLYNTVGPKKRYNRAHAVDWFRPFRFRQETGARRLQPQS